MQIGMVALVALALVGVTMLGLFFLTYNGLILVRENLKKAWANIDVILKQRADEIPKLISTIESFMQYEKGIIQDVVNARTAMMQAKTVSEKSDASNLITQAMGKIIAWAENYPEVKASENFIQFQNRVTELEETLAHRREYYNDSVNTYNIRIQSLPDVFIARILGFQREEMFRVSHSEKRDPKVQFKVPA